MFFLRNWEGRGRGGALPPPSPCPPRARWLDSKLRRRRRLATAIDGGVVWADCPPSGGASVQTATAWGAVGSVGFCWRGSRPRTQIAPPPIVNPTGPVPTNGAQRHPPRCGVRPQPGAVFRVGRRPRPARLMTGARALPRGIKKRGRAIGLRSRYAARPIASDGLHHDIEPYSTLIVA